MTAGFLISRLYFFLVKLVAFLVNKLYVAKKIPPLTNELTNLSAVELANRIRSQKVTSEEVVVAFITRIQQLNDLNSVVETNFDSALAIARTIDRSIASGSIPEEKPFLGVPFTVKDCIAVEGLLCTAGIVARQKTRMDQDAAVVERMKAAGGILLAVTNVSEVCMWWESSNRLYGRTNNPYDSRRIVGGSSGGEAALLASGGSPIGIGSDIGGSIRMPAFFNGIFGHKPSPNVVPDNGCIPPIKGYPAFMHSAGPMSRFAEDLAPMLKILVGPEAVLKLNLDSVINLSVSTIRFFYMEEMRSALIGPVDEHQHSALRKAVRYLETKFNLEAIRVDLPLVHWTLEMWLNDMKDEENPSFSVEMLNREAELSVATEFFSSWLRGRSAHTFPAIGLAALEKVTEKLQKQSTRERLVFLREKLYRQFQQLLGSDGVFLFPTHPTVAPFHNQPIWQPLNFAYTSIFNCLALPATQIPLGISSSGMPVGIQVVAAREQDRLCLAVAAELEKGFGGWVTP